MNRDDETFKDTHHFMELEPASLVPFTYERDGDPDYMCIDPEIATKIKCPICLGFLRQPVVDSCQHHFCRDCITQILKSKPICPLSRQKLALSELQEPPRLLMELILDTKVRCPHKGPTGVPCEWQGSLSQFNQTHSKDCSFREAICCHSGCPSIFRIWEYEAHIRDCEHRLVRCLECSGEVRFKDVELHTSSCLEITIECPNDCGAEFRRRENDSHYMKDCPNTIVHCPYYKQGCAKKPRRCELRDHLREMEVEHACIVGQVLDAKQTALTEFSEARVQATFANQKADQLAGTLQAAMNDIASIRIQWRG